MKYERFLLCLLLIAAQGAGNCEAGMVSLAVSSEEAATLPCRIHLSDENGKAYYPAGAPFWKGGFVCDGKATVELRAGQYRYEIERGPEWQLKRGTVEVVDEPIVVTVELERIANLKEEGWFGGDLHVHRSPGEMPLHMQAEDLSVASVQTWWNARNPWSQGSPAQTVHKIDGRYYDILSGEDERGGGALLYHRMNRVIDITKADREWPSSVVFLEAAKEAGGWAEIEKPFWRDTPLWLSTGHIDSVGIAQNHMQRRGVLENEAWGRPRDRSRYPGVHGNGRYTQDLYYKILNCGFRLPPSAGSASGVLANPVGYNRVYVHTGSGFGWDAWWEGLRKGRCFVTNGPLLRLTANGMLPGEVLKSDGALEVRVEGKLDSRDRIKRIEVVENGAIRKVELPATLTLERSGWFLMRVLADVEETFRFASTAPWYVEIDEAKMAPDRESAEFFLRWARKRRATVEGLLKDAEKRREVSAVHRRAVEFWEAIVDEASGGGER